MTVAGNAGHGFRLPMGVIPPAPSFEVRVRAEALLRLGEGCPAGGSPPLHPAPPRSTPLHTRGCR